MSCPPETPRYPNKKCAMDGFRRLAEQKPRHRAQGAQNTSNKQDAAKTPLCSATRRLRCEEEALVGRRARPRSSLTS